LLETFAEGVQKAYDTSQNEFIALKKFKKEEANEEWLEEIMIEDVLLQNIEKIRVRNPNYNQYFIKYDGLFKDVDDGSNLILKRESGCVTLDNILEAGKVFSCKEVLYIHRKLVEGLSILEENGIANRNINTQNIILVENPANEGGFFYKISDFGRGCQLTNNTSLVPVNTLEVITNNYVAPEVMKLLEKDDMQEAEYNPFLSDVYSIGLLTLKMINRSWGEKELKEEMILLKEKLQEYEPVFDILTGMLEEDPKKRWDFKKMLKFYQDNENNSKFCSIIPTDESLYYYKWQIEFEEKSQGKTLGRSARLFEEHQKLYIAYNQRGTMPNQAKFHLDRALEFIKTIKESKQVNENEENWKILERMIFCWNALGDWFRKKCNFFLSEESFIKSLTSIYDWQFQLEKVGKDGEKKRNNDQIKQLEAQVFNCLGTLYDDMGNLNKAEDFFLKSFKIYEDLFGDNHSYVGTSMSNLGKLYQNMGNLPKAEEFFLKSLKINQDLFSESHLTVAFSWNNLGLLYQNMGNLPKAEEFYLKSLKIFQNLLGENHSDVGISMNNIGGLYEDMGDLPKAEEFYKKSLKNRENLFGKNHSEVAMSLNNLGCLFHNMGKLTEAEEFFKESLKIKDRIFGENHVEIALSLNNLGNLYLKMGWEKWKKLKSFY